MRLLGRSEPTAHDQILDHYKSFWGRRRVDDLHWTPGPLARAIPDLHIAKVAPDRRYGFWTFLTIGAWRATQSIGLGLEFMAVSRDDDPAMLLRLGMIAKYQAGPESNHLGVGHLLPIGEGWVEGSPLTAILFSLPYLWGPNLEHCPISGGHVQVIWAIPIYDSERAYAREHGADALEQRFEAAKFDYLDPFRPSVLDANAA